MPILNNKDYYNDRDLNTSESIFQINLFIW